MISFREQTNEQLRTRYTRAARSSGHFTHHHVSLLGDFPSTMTTSKNGYHLLMFRSDREGDHAIIARSCRA